MRQIIVENLVKTFRVSERTAGLWGAVRGVIHRRHRTVRALDGVSFALDAGELVGYIGPNGAGKSTTVKTLAGILVPDSGRCEVLGRVAVARPHRPRGRYRRRVRAAHATLVGPAGHGVVRAPSRYLSRAAGQVRCGTRRAHRSARPRAAARCACATAQPRPTHALRSRGGAPSRARRSCFSTSPRSASTPSASSRCRDFVKRLNQERGVTVILTTHDMDDIEALCTRVIVIGERPNSVGRHLERAAKPGVA